VTELLTDCPTHCEADGPLDQKPGECRVSLGRPGVVFGPGRVADDCVQLHIPSGSTPRSLISEEPPNE
jgi:hypothetical protein